MHSYFLSPDMTVTYGSGVPQTLPPTAHPPSITATAEGWALHGPLIPILSSISGPIPGTFDAYLQSLEPWEVSLFEQFEYHGDIFFICEAMEAEEFDAASNGLVYRNGSAAFGWILSVQGSRMVQCSGPAYGHIALKLMRCSPSYASSTDCVSSASMTGFWAVHWSVTI